MADKYVIFLNGPPGSGKDTCAELAIRQLPEVNCQVVKFAAPLREALCALMGIGDSEVEEFKKGRIDFNPRYGRSPTSPGYTGRDLMISISEDVVKNLVDVDLFAKRAAEAITDSDADVFFVTDAGFDYEVAACIDEIGVFGERGVKYHYALWRIHRPGKSFDGDSRAYINTDTNETLSDVSSFSVYNSGDLVDLEELTGVAVRHTFGAFFKRELADDQTALANASEFMRMAAKLDLDLSNPVRTPEDRRCYIAHGPNAGSWDTHRA